MPELPEVETVCQGLAPVLEGAQIVDVMVRRPDLRWPFPTGFARRLRGRRTHTVWRRGKYYLWSLDDGVSVLGHLGMSGSWTIAPSADAAQTLGPHDHVRLTLEHGAVATYLDPRRFGIMTLVASALALEHPLLVNLGPEPLSAAFNGSWLCSACHRRTAAIKTTLMDQKVAAGIGNIYACEALHRGAIHPARAANSLGATEYDDLAVAVKDVLREAITLGGASLRDHRCPSGEIGYFQQTFAVYGRAGQPCQSCVGLTARPGRRIPCIERMTQVGRTTFFCPACQV